MKAIPRRLIGLLLSISCLLGWLQLGATALGTAPSSVTPAIGFGNQFTVALHSDGSVYAWGDNTSGTLGNGTNQNSNTPVAVSFPEGTICTAIAVGYDHVLALTSDGFLYSWGADDYGQLGLGGSASKNTPQRVTLPAGVTVTAIAAGKQTSYALAQNGSVYAWGNNDKAQLGTPATNEFSRSTPGVISSLSGVFVAKLYAGIGTAAVIDANGAAWVFGDNENSQLGIENQQRVTPTKLQGKTDLPAIVNDIAFGNTSTTLLGNGAVYSMGKNTNGQFGNGATPSSPTTVLKPATLSATVSEIAASSLQTVFLSVSGEIYRCGQVFTNDGSPKNITTPELLSCGGKTVSTIGAGYGNAGAIAQDGSVWTWGDNTAGQLGDGTTNTSEAPVQVKGVGGEGTLTLGSSAQVRRVSLRAVAAVPAPTYTVTVPTGIDAGDLYQTAVGAEDAISDTSFSVKVENVDNLFGEKKLVIRMRGATGAFTMTAENGDILPYTVCIGESGSTAIESNGVFGEMTADGICRGRIRIDRSTITSSGKYEGQVFFDISVEELAAGGEGT